MIILGYVFSFFIHTYAVDTHKKRLGEALLMSIHNKCFHVELEKINPELSSLTSPLFCEL